MRTEHRWYILQQRLRSPSPSSKSAIQLDAEEDLLPRWKKERSRIRHQVGAPVYLCLVLGEGLSKG
ncbi:unnamed protein product [Strongylus vulgaris]|uniref:Uncharacterized protein n=1 Tax=Strongylus vulgaris TaxID=40348 RepID=A0A3P7IQ44_STRVU|nr:unnamed protein product [Strongylus vulgaris]